LEAIGVEMRRADQVGAASVDELMAISSQARGNIPQLRCIAHGDVARRRALSKGRQQGKWQDCSRRVDPSRGTSST